MNTRAKELINDLLKSSSNRCALCGQQDSDCLCPGVKQPIMYYTQQSQPIRGKYQTIVHGTIDVELHKKLKSALGTGGTWSPKMFTFRGERSKVASKLKSKSKELGYIVDW